MVVLGAPGGGDPVAQLALEAGPAERDVAQDRHHVDDEGFPLGAVEGFAAGLVDEREQVRRRLDVAGIAAGRDGGGAQAFQDAAQRRDRLAGPGEVAVGLLTGQLHELLAIGGDEERDAVDRREHRLDRRQAGRARGEAFAGPQRAELVDRRTDPGHGLGRGVGDCHLGEPQRKTRPETHDDSLRQQLVERGAGHRQDDGVARVGIDRSEGDAERALLVRGQGAGDRGSVRDGVALEVRVVDPDRVEAGVAGAARPVDHVRDVAPSGQTQANATRQCCHLAPAGGCLGRWDAGRLGGSGCPDKMPGTAGES